MFPKQNGVMKQVNTVNTIKNNITFGNYTRTYQKANNTITEYYNDNNILYRKIEYDEFKRDIDTKEFNPYGVIISHQHKKYYKSACEEGYIETFKNKYQQYIRKSCTKIVNGLKHSIDDFKSITSSHKSYVNDFVYDKTGKLIKIIQNGISSVI